MTLRKLREMPALTRVELIALLPTPSGCAVFLGDGEKSIVFYIDPVVGASINAVMNGEVSRRPLTHDLLMLTLQGFGASITRGVIIKMENDVYYARLILEATNEVMERKIVELDARPSDCLALIVRSGAPFYVLTELWNRLEDMTDVLNAMRKSSPEEEVGPPDLGIF